MNEHERDEDLEEALEELTPEEVERCRAQRLSIRASYRLNTTGGSDDERNA